MRPSKRAADEMRPVSFERGVARYAEGSCLVRFGETHVLCAASLEDKPPPWLRGQGRGWVTAEYAMLPRATLTRTRRESSAGKVSGRSQEIQRLIGRSLRAVVDLPRLGERQITIDCDVLQADGGTRTASITGAWIALRDCLHWMAQRSILRESPLKDHVAAVSCGIAGGEAVIDLDYIEDFERAHRREFRHDRLGRPGRSSGVGGGRAVLGGGTHPNAGACAGRYREPRRHAEGGSRAKRLRLGARAAPAPRRLRIAVRKNVHGLESREVEAHAIGQVSESSAREFVPTLAFQHGVKLLAQGVQMQHVRCGIGELRFAQRIGPPIGRLLLLGDLDVEQLARQVLESMPVGIGSRDLRGDLGAIDRARP